MKIKKIMLCVCRVWKIVVVESWLIVMCRTWTLFQTRDWPQDTVVHCTLTEHRTHSSTSVSTCSRPWTHCCSISPGCRSRSWGWRSSRWWCCQRCSTSWRSRRASTRPCSTSPLRPARTPWIPWIYTQRILLMMKNIQKVRATSTFMTSLVILADKQYLLNTLLRILRIDNLTESILSPNHFIIIHHATPV